MTNLSRRKFFGLLGGAVAVGSGAAMTLQGGVVLAQNAENGSASAALRPTAFSFLHTYESTGRYWRGIEKAGLVRPTTGVRLVNSPWGEDARRFNSVAKIGGELERILRERKCHFIVDRVVGGSQYYPYPFDTKLIEHYSALLGNRLLGGQVHETMSNTGIDWSRWNEARKKIGHEPTLQEFRNYFTGEDAPHWLDYGTPDDYMGRTPPAKEADWWKEYERAAKAQGARFGSHFSYCEGTGHGQLIWHIFYKYGATACIVEVGPWASNRSQFAIASLRGAAKAAQKPWSVFFAPWGPQGCTCFIPLSDISWRIPEKTLISSGLPAGPKLGCSSAIQRRIFFHTYLSGAHTLHEEWGAECNLTNWDEGTLSSYGRVTKNFLDFQDAHPDVGEPFTPIAMVIDSSVPPDKAAWAATLPKLFQYSEADTANAARKGSGKEEAACYPPCALPEVFDVVPSDAPAEVLAGYKEIIPVGSAAPAGTKPCPPNELYDRLAAAVRKWSPFERKSHLLMQINHRKSDGAWIVSLYNPWGAVRGDVENTGSVLNDACAIQDVLRPTFAAGSVRTLHAWPAGSQASLQGKEIPVTVGPGGVLIMEVRPA